MRNRSWMRSSSMTLATLSLTLSCATTRSRGPTIYPFQAPIAGESFVRGVLVVKARALGHDLEIAVDSAALVHTGQSTAEKLRLSLRGFLVIADGRGWKLLDTTNVHVVNDDFGSMIGRPLGV